MGALRRLLTKIEPWYDRGTTTVFRLDAKCPDFSDEVSGEAHHFELQWLGIHLGLTIGRTPQRNDAR